MTSIGGKEEEGDRKETGRERRRRRERSVYSKTVKHERFNWQT